jgi:hypothetical protein
MRLCLKIIIFMASEKDIQEMNVPTV